MLNIRSTIIQTLAKFPSITICTVFGTAARNKLHLQSDNDIAIAEKMPLSPDKYFTLIDELSRNLHREIDLIDFHKANGLILSEALCNGKILFCKDKTQLINLIQKVWMYNADMLPFIKKILETRNKRFAYG